MIEFNRTKDIELAKLTNTSAVIRMHYKKGFAVTRDVCNWNLGIYLGMAKVSGARGAKIRETRCVVDGDDFCQFDITWQVPGMFNRLYTAALKTATKDLVTEYKKTVRDRDRLIENLVVFEGVDPNRVYLLGYSAGGDGVYQLAPRMAGGEPGCGASRLASARRRAP